MRRKKCSRENLLDIALYRQFGEKQFRLHAEYPKLHSEHEIAEDRKTLRAMGYITKVVPTPYGFGIYKLFAPRKPIS